VLLLAFVLRVQGINDDGYWLDEVTSLHDSMKPLGAILHGKGQPGHPPLYYLLLKGWIALFGTSETAVRMLSAVFGTAAVGVTFALFRALHGRAAGLAASLLLALSFHHVVFSQEARNYALFGFLAVLSAHALWRALAEGGRRRWAIYVACALLMVYTHHQGYVVLFGAAVGAILAALLGRMPRGALRGLALADLVVVLAAAPSIVLYLIGVGGTARGYYYWQDHVAWRDLVDTGVTWTPGSPLFAPGSSSYGPGALEVPRQPWLALTLLLPAACLALAWWRARPSPRPPPILFHFGVLYAGVGAFVVIALLKPIWHARYVLVYLPFHLGALAVLLAALRRPRARLVALGVLVALSIPGLVEEKRVPGRTPWRETAAFLSDHEGHAVILLGPRYLTRPLRWYYKRPFGIVPDAPTLVRAVRQLTDAHVLVFVVYCEEHAPPDPHHLAAQELARTLETRGRADFGPLQVYEFARKR
jgi:4-amino-4-deoxy-L-arabinose transferase-like glycosyltransferase